MRFPARDIVASVFVGLAMVIYLAWLLTLTSTLDVWVVAIAILVLGMAASVSAVIPGFDELLHGSRAYLVGASVLGLVAFAAGLWAIYAGDELSLAVLTVATLSLWAAATLRHSQNSAATAV